MWYFLRSENFTVKWEARASDFEASRVWFKRAVKREARNPRAREARARACSEARVVALRFFTTVVTIVDVVYLQA